MPVRASRSAGRTRLDAKRRELRIAPDTTGLSFIHWAVRYDGGNWGRNLAVYLASIVCTYGLMMLAALTQIPSGMRVAPSIFNDWAIMFAFLASFPAILFFVASDQRALELAMNRVWAAGVVTERKEFVEKFRERWKARFRRLNLSVQTFGLLASLPLSYLTAYGYKAADAHSWAQASAPTGYAYMAGIALFYALLMIYIARGVAMAWLLKSIANEWTIVLSPLHPDGCGGLQPLGRIGLRNQYALTILGINIALVAITIYEINPALEATIIVPALAVYLIFGPVIFLGPLLPFRRVMSELRRTMMEEIAAPLDAKFGGLTEQARVNGAVSKQDLEALERLRTIGATVGEMSIWPFDAPTMRVFATAYIIPVLLAIATKLAELVVEHVTN